MPSLDTRGKIAAAEIAFYFPIAVLSAYLLFRYALRRDAGWLFLFLFSLARMATGATLVAAQMTTPTNIKLFLATYILDYAGILPLLFSSLGFIGMAGQHTYSENPRVATALRLTGLLGLAGLGLVVAGGVLGNPQTPSKETMATALRRAGTCLYAATYVVLFITHIGAWTYRWHLRSYRRSLLFGISTALPFLGVRIAYAILSTWSSNDLFGTKLSSNNILAKFNPITGNWILYLVMDLVMEFVVAVLYLFSSTVLARKHR